MLNHKDAAWGDPGTRPVEKREVDIYSIPLEEDCYLVYRPLLPLAFLANGGLVNELAQRLTSNGIAVETSDTGTLWDFVQAGVLSPDPPMTSVQPDSNFPTTAVLCLTNSCNLRCVYCYAEAGQQPRRSLSLVSGARVIDAVHRNALALGQRMFSVAFHGGGEPTAAWNTLIALTEETRRKSLPATVGLTSNGYWTKLQRDWIISSIDEVSLSFDGPPEIQNTQRPTASGGDSFPAVWEAVQALDENNKRYGIRLTVTDQSVLRLPETIEWFCRETGCPIFQVEPAFATGRGRRGPGSFSRHTDFVRQFLDAHDVAVGYGRHLYYSGSRPWVTGTRFCQASCRALIIRPDNSLTTCYEVSDRSHPLNPLFEAGQVRDGIVQLDSDSGRELDRRLMERREACRDCFNFWHCAGDCPAKTMGPGRRGHLEFGERCEVNREITKGLLLRYITRSGGVWRGQFPEGTPGARRGR